MINDSDDVNVVHLLCECLQFLNIILLLSLVHQLSKASQSMKCYDVNSLKLLFVHLFIH